MYKADINLLYVPRVVWVLNENGILLLNCCIHYNSFKAELDMYMCTTLTELEMSNFHKLGLLINTYC